MEFWAGMMSMAAMMGDGWDQGSGRRGRGRQEGEQGLLPGAIEWWKGVAMGSGACGESRVIRRKMRVRGCG